MEVKFRPLQASSLARHVAPGQGPSEDGQSFLEVVENVASAEQAPGENPNSGHDKEKPSRQTNPTGDSASQDRTPESIAATVPQEQAGSPRNKTIPEEKYIGAHIDMTA
jgi:hypothetical protein